MAWVAEPVDKDAIDWYFLGYGHQYKKALGDFIKVAGRQPMPPLYVLGYWYSKYQRYTSDEFMEIVNDVNDEELANMAICLCHQVDKALAKYIERKDREFTTEGGIRERMTAARLNQRETQRQIILVNITTT